MEFRITQELKQASDEEIAAKLAHANPLVLRAMLYHANVDAAMRDEVRVRRQLVGWIETAVVADDASDELVRRKALELIKAYREGTRTPPNETSDEVIKEAMSLAVDDDIPQAEFPYWSEELALDPMVRRLRWKQQADPAAVKDCKVIVIGAGVGGLNTAVQLQAAGFSYTVLEKNPAVGGVWYQNRYPGARVDSPSRIYSNTWAINYNFKHFFAPQAENEHFMNWCADHTGIRSNIRFSIEVVSADWLEDEQLWKVVANGPDGVETLYANAIISAVGFLDRPVIPHIEGVEAFKGVQMHTARFDNSMDLSDKRVAVIGTGASGLQILADLATMVKKLTVFQRSPGWVLPAPGYRDPFHDDVLWVQSNIPFYKNWERFILMWAVGDHTYQKFIETDPEWKEPGTINASHASLKKTLIEHLRDNTEAMGRPDLFEKLLPEYPPLAKRFILDYGFFEAFHMAHVDLVTDPIDHFVEDGIITKSGEKIPIDVVVYATGFRATDYLWPMKITGREKTLDQVWEKDGARAYWGITMPNMPNLFCIYGPNTNPTNTGPVQWGEMQVRYILQCLEQLIATGNGSLEVRQEVYDDYAVRLDEALSKMIYAHDGATSYYNNKHGRIATNAPWPSFHYWTNLRHPDFDEFIFARRSEESEIMRAGSNV